MKKWPVVSGQWPVTTALHLYAVAIVRNLKLVTGHWPLATVLL